MLRQILHPDRLERAGSNMQRDESAPDATAVQFGQQRFVEMQPGCRRRDRAGLLRVDRLIAFTVPAFIGPIDIGRQWHVAMDIQKRQHRAVELQQIEPVLARLNTRLATVGELQP